MAVPIGIHGYRYCFVVFLANGFFTTSSDLHHYILTTRCSMLACSYAILISHFLYRYLVVLRSEYTKSKFPIFMMGTFELVVIFFVFFGWICENLLNVRYDVKLYVLENFREEYGEDIMKINAIGAIYEEASETSISNSFTGIGLLIIFSTISVSLYILFGYLIMKKLNETAMMMSKRTASLQRKLLKALTVQTVIPICVSFMPSVIVWFSPIFNFSMGRTFNYYGVIALSAFPFLDPLAIIFFLPILRQRITRRISKSPSGVSTSYALHVR